MRNAPWSLGSETLGGEVGSLFRSRLPAVPARGHEAVPERGPLLQGQVRHRTSQLRARPARPAPFQGPRLWFAASRKAESEAHLRPARTAVSSVLQTGFRATWHHRRQPAPAAEASARPRPLLAGIRIVARTGAATRPARTHRGQR